MKPVPDGILFSSTGTATLLQDVAFKRNSSINDLQFTIWKLRGLLLKCLGVNFCSTALIRPSQMGMPKDAA